MKKWLVIGALLAVMGIVAIPAFAGDADTQDWFEEMFSLRKAQVDKMVESGQLTKEQGTAFNEHFDSMYDWHQQNEFVCPGAGMGLGRGNGPRWMNNSDSPEVPAGFGPGMGGGFRGGWGPSNGNAPQQ